MLEPTVRGPSPTDSLQAAGSAPTVEEPQQSSCCNCPKRMKLSNSESHQVQQCQGCPSCQGGFSGRGRDFATTEVVQPANAAPAPSFPSTPIPLVLQPRRLFSEQPGSSSDDFADGPSWPEEVPLEPFPEDELSADLSDELRRDGLSGEELFSAERTPFASPSASPSRRSPSPHLGSALAAARMRALEAMREGSETPTSDVATPNRSLPPLPPTPGAPGSGMRRTMTHVASPSDSANPAENFMMVELSQILTQINLGTKRSLDDAT